MNTWERLKIGLSVLGRIHAVLRDLPTRGRHRRIARLLRVAGEAPRQLPRPLVHGDFSDDNVYFWDGRIVLVTDLDFMGVGPRVDDLALTLYYTNSTEGFR